jgi:hypothetical protein
VCDVDVLASVFGKDRVEVDGWGRWPFGKIRIEAKGEGPIWAQLACASSKRR